MLRPGEYLVHGQSLVSEPKGGVSMYQLWMEDGELVPAKHVDGCRALGRQKFRKGKSFATIDKKKGFCVQVGLSRGAWRDVVVCGGAWL